MSFREVNLASLLAHLRGRLIVSCQTLKQATGAYLVGSALSGYTRLQPFPARARLALVENLAKKLTIPVIAEGWIETPVQSDQALTAGAFAVVVAGAITRPQWITQQVVTGLAKVKGLRETQMNAD